MNDQEVMSLVNRIINYNNNAGHICQFVGLLTAFLIAGSLMVAFLTQHGEVIIEIGVFGIMLNLILAVGTYTFQPSKTDGEKIIKEVQVKRVVKYTSWKQDKNGNYYFGKNKIDAGNVDVIRHTPKLSKPEVKVTINKISNRFTNSQKDRIHQALNITDVTLEKKQAVINE